MTAPTITALPTAPTETDNQTTFNTRAYALVQALADFVSETNTSVSFVNDKAAESASSASDATTQAANAASSASFEGAWDAGTTYSVGDSVSYNGAIWRALQASTNSPPEEGADWTRVLITGGASYRYLYGG